MPTLEWIGKDKVINHHLDVPYRVLERKYSYDEGGQHEEDNGSENMIIHGDNLDALKSLLPQYEGRIKCIYIDPPYNTGNEGWVYNDNVNDPRIKKWLGDVVGKEGEDLTRHDKWLCMMYPRLKLLQRLLSGDGAIFISIDYHEQFYLRAIMNEIFGDNNFVSEIACVNKPSGRSDDKYIATAHESILIYRKSPLLVLGGFAPSEKITKRYSKIEEGTGRRYREEDLRKRGSHDERTDRPNLFYPFFYHEETGDLIVGSNEDLTPDGYVRIEPIKDAGVEGTWRWGRDSAIVSQKYLHPRYMPNKRQWSVFEWEYLDERGDVKPTTVWDFKDVNSERGTEMFSKFLGFPKNAFQNPKPVGTIERIVKISTNDHDVILDSFAGSGTTAQAVLNINKDGGNRRFILVEMMDYADSITAERAKRVIKGYGTGKQAVEGTGGSFSYYELGEPLMIGDNLNENVGIDKIREYVFFTDTKCRLPEPHVDEPYFLGTHVNNAYYFYYERDAITTLNRDFLHTVKTKADAYVIYADLCMLSDAELEAYHITFKKIPRDITKL